MALYSLCLRRALLLSPSFLHYNLQLHSSKKISTFLFNPSLSSNLDAQKSKKPIVSNLQWFRFFRSSPVSLSTRRNLQDDQEIGPDTIDFPRDQDLSSEQMVDTYVQTAGKVFGSVEEAKKRIDACSTTTSQGFQVECSKETSEKFKDVPGVVFIGPVNKEYGGDKYINATIIPQPPPIQYTNDCRQSNQRYDDSRQMQERLPPRPNYGPPEGPHDPLTNYAPPPQAALLQQSYRPTEHDHDEQRLQSIACHQNYAQGPQHQQNYELHSSPPPQPNSEYPPRHQNYSMQQAPPPHQNYAQAQGLLHEQSIGRYQNYAPEQKYGHQDTPAAQQSGGWDQHHGGSRDFHHLDNGYQGQKRFEGHGDGQNQSYMPTRGGNFSPGPYNENYASDGNAARFSQSEPKNDIYVGRQVADQYVNPSGLFYHAQESDRNLLCLDVGEKIIGVALSDESNITAYPMSVIRCERGFSSINLDSWISNMNFAGLVIFGEPYVPGVMPYVMGLDLLFADMEAHDIGRIMQIYKIRYTFWNEVFSPKLQLIKRGRKQIPDKFSAAWILQAYLDEMNRSCQFVGY